MSASVVTRCRHRRLAVLGATPDFALAKVPDKARAKRNPLERDPDAAAAGEKFFEQHCADLLTAVSGRLAVAPLAVAAGARRAQRLG
jgi:hypothetical protein